MRRLILPTLLLWSTTIAAQDTDLDGIGHDLGRPDAAILVVEYGDFACGACAEFATLTWPTIRKEFVETGRVRWKFVSFELGFRNSEEGARAAECGAEQGMFWELHDALFADRNAWVDERNPKDSLTAIVGRAGLDRTGFLDCYEDDRYEDRTKASNRAARRDGVRGTPTFLIDGFPVQGALPLEAFRLLLESPPRGPGSER